MSIEIRMRTHLNLSIEEYLLEKAKKENINISGVLSDALILKLNMLKAGGKIEEDIIEKELELKQLERAKKELENKEWARPFIKECFKLITSFDMSDELFEEYHT